jgi:hypothetical protein
MFKQVALLKRHPSMTKSEFIQYYESHHAKIGEKYLKGRADRYLRRYLFPIVDPVYGVEGEPEYDVLMEIWFADEATYRKTLASLTTPEATAEIVADELRLFDRSKNRFFTIEEHETPM